MPVCLHCGEVGPEGALFCGKCGYTLPQAGQSGPSSPMTVPSAPAPSAPTGYVAPSAVIPPRVVAAYAPTGPYLAPAPTVPGAMGPISPPPNAKYCSRCATVISSAAVYCPICQQPQG